MPIRLLAALALLILALLILAVPSVWAGGATFVDATATAGLFGSQSPLGLSAFLSGGTVGDFDRNGYPDIFVACGGGVPDRLFMNQGDGSFVESAAAWGIAESHGSTAGVAGDYDGDGWLDLFVTSFGPPGVSIAGHHKLYHNNGDGTFTDVAEFAGVNYSSATVADGYGGAFGDYDLDGDLDLLVSGWSLSSNGNRLFRNDGDGTFTDVTTSVGLSSVSSIYGFSPRFADMDGDRYPEILWIGDFGTSRYYVNDGDGTFTDATFTAGIGFATTEMGQTLADFDRDGDFDWYVTTISDNRLYRNGGAHVFTDMSFASGADFTGWGWGTVAVDFDQDGRIDLAAATQNAQNYLLMNDSADPTTQMHFDDQSYTSGFATSTSGRGMANLDYDLDGDQDVVVFTQNGPTQLLRNDTAGGHWIRIIFDTSGKPTLAPDGIGTVVRITTGSVVQNGRIDSGSNYLSQSELSVHFGLADASSIDLLEVFWADGGVTTLADLAVDQHLLVIAATAFRRGDVNGDGTRDLADAISALQALFSGGALTCRDAADVNDDGGLDVADPVYLLSYQFSMGPAPASPDACGADPTGDGLDCESFAGCP